MGQRKNFTVDEAIEYLIAAKAIPHRLAIGTNRQQTSLALPAGAIDKRPNGYFHRDDLNRLISWIRIDDNRWEAM
jgi:hypothetical protein